MSAAKKRTTMTENTQPVWLAVEEDSINILEGQSLVSLPAHHSNPVLFIIYLFFRIFFATKEE